MLWVFGNMSPYNLCTNGRSMPYCSSTACSIVNGSPSLTRHGPVKGRTEIARTHSFALEVLIIVRVARRPPKRATGLKGTIFCMSHQLALSLVQGGFWNFQRVLLLALCAFICCPGQHRRLHLLAFVYIDCQPWTGPMGC